MTKSYDKSPNQQETYSWDHDHLILYGGGGAGKLANLVGTDYLFSSRARPENLFLGKSRTEYLFLTITIFWKSKARVK